MSRVSLVLFCAFALVDWIAVARHSKRFEYVFKPATLIALMLYASSGPAPPRWLLPALGFSLLGDLLLMLPLDAFIAGVGAFLLAHLAYVAAFASPFGPRVLWWLLLIVIMLPLSTRIVRGAGHPVLRVAMGSYIAVIMLMVASAIASGRPIAVAGAILFLVSDSIIGWSRFVGAVPFAQPLIMVTYHVGQLLLVVALRSG